MLTIEAVGQISRSTPPETLARDEAFWARFGQLYERDSGFVQLNYGFYHPSLRPVLEVEIAALRELNRRGAHFKQRDSAGLLEAARADAARVAGASPEEIVLTRNASESLNVVIQGLPLAAGDEVLCTDQDYTAVNQALDQRARYDGIRVVRVPVPLDPRDDEEVVALFRAALTPRTRLFVVTHMIHLTGQLLPAGKLCALAREAGVPVLVDAAHSFGQTALSASALGCDYLTASLHKWLGAPLGTGLLFVRKDRIAGLRPLFGDTHYPDGDIRRLERFGNRPDSAYAGLREAIRWHEALGVLHKRARLVHLQELWTRPLRERPGFRVLTPAASERHGALGAFAVEGASAQALSDRLLREHGLFTAVVQVPGTSAVRVTPGLPTSAADLERLLAALHEPAPSA
jgi:selenocysteine lyase/cysteine desulfurase